MLTDARLDEIAAAVWQRDGDQAPLLIGLMLAEETGESVQQLRRLLGHARQTAEPADVGAELADIVITAAVLARLIGVDLSHHIAAKLDEGVR
jgi:NTP pyrophosphatase (non-canonical NTP hydrolase)